jgi:CheY-like chemotaxis protein
MTDHSRRPVVLAVDDEQQVRTILTRTLAALGGWEVLEACDGREALDLMTGLDETSPLDLIITDIRMPQLDGIELSRAAARVRPRTPVVFTTGFKTDDAFRLPPWAGTDRVLAKPFSPTQLLEFVRPFLPVG